MSRFFLGLINICLMLDMVPRNDSRETKTDTLSFTIFDTLFFVIIPDKSFSSGSVVGK